MRERNQEEGVRLLLGGSISTMRQERGRVVSLDSQKGTKRDTWRAERRVAPALLSMPTRRRLRGRGGEKERGGNKGVRVREDGDVGVGVLSKHPDIRSSASGNTIFQLPDRSIPLSGGSRWGI